MSYTRTRTVVNDSNDIIFYISTDNFNEFSKLINEANVNNIIDKKNGFTALHYAVKFNNNKMIEFLRNLDANPKIKTINNEDSYDLALKFQNKYLIDFSLKENAEDIAEFQKFVKSQERKIVDLESNNKFLLKSIDDAIFKNGIQKTEINNLKIAIADLKSENAIIKKDLNSISISKIGFQNKNIELNKQINILKPENETLQSELRTSKRKYDQLDQSYTGLLSKIQKK